MNQTTKYMQQALAEAHIASDLHEVPVGAVMVLPNDQILSTHNLRETNQNPLLHAEVRLIQEASKMLGNWRLNQCRLYVTLEPCPMCLGVMLQARLGSLFFGTHDSQRPIDQWIIGNSTLSWPTLKNIDSIRSGNHEMIISGGHLEDECQSLLQEFFNNKRN